MSDDRHLIINGHFYQPPRESPWTGLISPEAGAAPFANWNERILSECYTANARAHISDGRVAHICNNYEQLSFDFGPTLLNWLERHGPIAYRAMLSADKLSLTRHAGHGSAMAQSYNHSILPLLSARDRELQIAWGIEDFNFRFGRQPEGMWLPECAADDATLGSVSAAGLKFVILAPSQGAFEGDGLSEHEAGPFLWNENGRQLAIFRFDHERSAMLSFGDALSDGGRLAELLSGAVGQLRPSAALLIATDGETFGHHKKGGASALARAFKLLEAREDLTLTTCAAYLASHSPVGSFKSRGPSSWSCPHGVERWRSDCGCRSDSRTNQQWRGPLREAMDLVKNHVSALYDRSAATLLPDPFAALKESIRLAVDSSPDAQERFFSRHRVAEPAGRSTLLNLFEMERAAQAVLTSCAWFFDDFGGPEGRVALRWAARAVELAEMYASSIEADLLSRLRPVHSNRREIGDAASLYLSLKAREARGRK